VKFQRISRVLSIGIFAIIGLIVAKSVYNFWRYRAIAEAVTGKTYRVECSASSLLECKFTEIPPTINWAVGVYIPTALTLAVITAAAIFAVAYLKNLYAQTLSTVTESLEETSEGK
jgi:hypothetical protein